MLKTEYNIILHTFQIGYECMYSTKHINQILSKNHIKHLDNYDITPAKWSRPIYYIFFHYCCCSSLCFFIWSLFFAQVDVYDTATQQQGDTHPGQDEAVAKVSCGQLS